MAQPELAQPGDEPLDPALADRDLGQRAAEHDRDAARGVALELGLQIGGDERRAPAELDDVDAVAGDLEQPVDLGHRQAPVDHVGDAVLARLGGPRGNVEEAGYGAAVALSAPTITTTFADPPSEATAALRAAVPAQRRSSVQPLRHPPW